MGGKGRTDIEGEVARSEGLAAETRIPQDSRNFYHFQDIIII